MRAFSWLRTRRRTLVSAGIVTVSAIAVTTMAVAYEGFPTTEVDLHDGGVWITKTSSVLVGHFNHESRVLDGGLRASGDDYDVLQEGGSVFVHDDRESTLTAVDPAMVTLADAAKLPAGAKVALGGPTLAVLDPASGNLWAVRADAASGFSPEGAEPAAELGEGAEMTVGRDGTVYAVSPKDKAIVTVPMSPDGETGEPSSREIDVPDDGALSITVVGTTAAVLDADTGVVQTSSGVRTEVPHAAGAVLQQPSATGDAVVLATAGDLVRVPLDGSAATGTPSEAGEGAPAAPVSLNGCAYGAWSGSGAFVRDCSDDANDLTAQLDDIQPNTQLRFRQNRDVVVLNDVVGGAAWMATDALQRVDNWDDIIPPEGDAEEDEDTTEETVETTLPERTEVNTPPIAVDDDFGVRPGRTVVLPVLDNDTDADGDVLTITLPDGDPAMGPVQAINNGSALQIAVPETASGGDVFRYEVDDGRGGTDTASVRLTVRPWDVNAAPTPKRVTTVVVESGGSITYNVLPDWIDPDGDEIFLSGVTPADGDEADFTSDGRISYRAIGGTQGRKDVPIIISDGSDVTEGIVRFDVRPPGSTVPVTNADHVVVRAGQTATVAPLTNDTSSGREPLRLTRVDQVAGAEIVPDYANKTFTFRSAAPAVYYVQYLVAAGPNAVPGLVRVDVLPDADTDLPPVAVRDVALLPSGGDVLVNVLANDSDPSGGILVVQSVTVDPTSGISVAVLGHETLRITDQSALGEQTRISYRISNGQQTAEGEVVVIPVPAPDTLRPPVANDDQAVVRAGDVVTIPVLENDYHPNDDTMHLAPDLVAPLPAPEDGQIFVSQDTVRFKAGPEAKTVYATYEVVDSSGQKDAGYVTIQILPVNADTNQAPRPRDLTARTLSGSEVRVPIPLDGIDPDGDSVELIGIDSAPAKGRVTEVGSNFLTYEAFAGETGPDAFTYRVRDRLGAEATAAIRIGIAPAESANQAPYAVKDSVVMRPGREVAVPVLANDSDPEGDAITLVSDGLILPDVAGLDARVVGDRVVVTSPNEPLETSLQYTIRDARGAEARAVLQVTVAEDVPLQRPIARDDRVRPTDVQEDQYADIDVLNNDEDPDGTVDALTISLDSSDARVLGDGVVRVPILETAQLITYTITDPDDLTASAFLYVPALGDLPPVLDSDGVEVKSGETIQIPLADHVRAVGGRDVVITEAAKVFAAHNDGASLVGDQRTLVYTSAAGYYGQDAITFEVTDGTGPDDPEGRKATLVLPVTVLPPDNQQPTFVDGQMDVAPGEDATALDLRALTTDPDEGDIDGMRYRVTGDVPDGFDASIDGQSLRVRADADVRKGTTAQVALEIDDGETEPVTGTVTVRVTASTRPLPTANDDVIAEADQGRTISVPVLANDFNPFPDRPLKVVAAATETGDGQAVVSGDQVSVTPSGNFFGTMVVRYRIQDATEDVDREVEGRIRLTVQGKPDAPGVPTVSSVQDRTVVLSWTPPPNNGAPITGYTVRSLAGGYTKACAATTCTLDGLTNNVEYNFVVTATNRVGESDPSAPSETARPDARPDTPAPPTLTFGDKSLNVAWTTPTTPGSPVESYTLEISPAPPSGITQRTATGNALVWDGLENGTAYQVRVQAHNRAPEPSSWSGYSATEIPAGPPAAPAAPTTTRLDPVGSQAQLQVNWQAPNNNGDAISGYELKVLRGGAVVNTLYPSAGQTSQAITVDPSREDYTFTVAAKNKAGMGQPSAPSAPRRAFTPPGAPQGVSASTPSNNGAIVVDYQPAASNGADPSAVKYQYSLNGGGFSGDWDGRTITKGISNGTSYTVTLRAVTTQDGTTYTGPNSNASNAAVPYGPIRDPGAGAAANGTQITFSWAPPPTNGRAITKLEINIDGGGWENVGVQNGSRTRDFGYERTVGIQVRATDAEGQTSSASAQDRTANRPQPRATVSKGGSAVGQPNCSSSSCAYLVVNTQDFPAGDYRVYCNSSRDGEFAGGGSRSLPANGSTQLGCYYGYPGDQVWVRIEGWGTSERFTWR